MNIKEILRGSLVYRWLTIAAAWFDRQWTRSCAALLLTGGTIRTESGPGVIKSVCQWIHRLWRRILELLGLPELLEGSIFKRTFFWTVLTVTIAPIAPTMVVLGVALLGFLAMALQFGCEPERRLVYSPVVKWIVAFAAVHMASTFTSVTLSGSLFGGLLTTAFTLFAIVFMNSVTERGQLRIVIRLMVAAGVVVALYGILQAFFDVDGANAWVDSERFSELSTRVYSTLDNPNVLSEYLLLVIPLAAALTILGRSRLQKGLAAGATLVMLVCLVLTWSRGGWLGIIFAAAIFLVLLDRRFIVLGLMGLAVLILFLPDSVISRFTSIGDMTDGSTSYRVYIWLGTLEMLRTYWVSGIGPGETAFRTVYPRYSFNAISAPHSHNLYLQILCESGFVGLTVFLGLLGSFVRGIGAALSKTRDRESFVLLAAVLSGMAGFLLQSFTDYSFYNYRVILLFWVMIALGASLTRDAVSEEKMT